MPLSRKQIHLRSAGGSVYVGAYINGGYQNTNRGASTATPPPWSASDAAPNTWDTFEGVNGAPLAGAMGGKRLSFVAWGASGSWPPAGYFGDVEDRARGRGAFSLYTWGPNAAGLADILADNATARSYMGTLFTAMKNQGMPMLFRPFWEFNGDWYIWGIPGGSGGSALTDAQYVTVWRNVWKYAADVMGGFTVGSGLGTHTGNLSFFWCANIFETGVRPSPVDRWPGEAYVDWIGWDGYAYPGTYLSPAGTFDTTYAALAGLAGSKPMMIGEWGVSATIGTPGKSAWYTEFFDNWLPAHPRIKAINYYDDGWAALPDGHIEDPESSRAVYAAKIAHPRFLSNIVNSSTFPLGTKVPVPG